MFPLSHVVMFTLCLVSITDVSTAIFIKFNLCLVSITNVYTATCCYVYVMSSKHSRYFHCYMLSCLRYV